MAINYNNLWKTLIDKNINKTDLRNLTGMSTATLAKLGKNDYVSLEIIDKICEVLDCQPANIMEYIPQDKASLITSQEK